MKGQSDTITRPVTINLRESFESVGARPTRLPVSLTYRTNGVGVTVDGVGTFYEDLPSCLAVKEIMTKGCCLYDGGEVLAGGHYVFSDLGDAE